MWKHHRNRPSSKEWHPEAGGRRPICRGKLEEGPVQDERKNMESPQSGLWGRKSLSCGASCQAPKGKRWPDRGSGLEAVLCDPVHFPNFSDEKN